MPLSRDHKASDPGEIKRVQEEGGRIITSNKVPRLHGKLAVTRAFGDYDLTVRCDGFVAVHRICCLFYA